LKIKDIKKDYYKLEKIAADWEKDVDDLLDYADQGLLKIHILVSPKGAFPLNSYAARQAVESPLQFLLFNDHISPLNGLITLVITHKEKEKFEERYRIDASDTTDGQHETQASVDAKKDIDELKQIAQDIQKVEQDQSVVAAILRDEHGAKGWQLVEILDIAPDLTNESSRQRAALRLSEKGRKILVGRAALK